MLKKHSVTKRVSFYHADWTDICERSHSTLGPEVAVCLYHPILSEWNTPTKGEISTPVNHQDFDYPISDTLCKHLSKDKNISTIEAQLCDCCAELKLQLNPNAIAVHPIKGSEWIPDWYQRCEHVLTRSLGEYSEATVNAPPDVAQEVIQVLFFGIHNYEVTVEPKTGRNQYILVGKKDDVAALESKLDRIIKDKHYATVEIKLSPAHLVYIDVCLRRTLASFHPQVTFKVNLQNGTLEVSGTSTDTEEFIHRAQTAKYATIEVRLPSLALRLLASNEGRETLQKHTLDYRIGYFFVSEDGSPVVSDLAPIEVIHLVGETKIQLSRAADNLSGSIAVDSVNTSTEFFESAMQTQAWDDLQRRLWQKYCLVQFHPEPSQGKLQLACHAEHVQEVKSEVIEFHEMHCYKMEAITLHQGQVDYLQKYCAEWACLQQEMNGQNVRCSVESNEQIEQAEIQFNGETTPVMCMVTKVQKCIRSIAFREMHVTAATSVKHLQSEAGKYQLTGIASSSKAAIQVVPKLQSHSDNNGSIHNAHSPFASLEASLHQEICEGRVPPGGITLSIMQGDLTDYHVDVMVNPANENLNHARGIARQFVLKGGEIIQFASNQYVAVKGQVKRGQAVLMNAVGSLPCWAMVHAVGPRWKDGADNELEWIKKTVNASLQEATCFTTVAFPAMCTGEFGVPVHISAQGMIEGIVAFAKENPASSIQKVIIMLHQEEHIDSFVARAVACLSDTTFKNQRFKRHTARKVAAVGNEEDAEVAKPSRRPSVLSQTITMFKAIRVKKGNLREQEVCMAGQYACGRRIWKWQIRHIFAKSLFAFAANLPLDLLQISEPSYTSK